MPHFVPWRWQIRTSGSMLHTVMPPPRAQGPENSNRLRTVPIAMSTAHSTRRRSPIRREGTDIEDSSKTKIPRCKPFLESSAEDLFPYDGMIRVRFAGQGVTSPNLSRNRPAPRRVICSAIRGNYTRTGGKCQCAVVRFCGICYGWWAFP